VLDRTKEPGAVGEPLYLDVVAALAEAMDGADAAVRSRCPRVIGGRYGLSSKEFTPSMVKPSSTSSRRRPPEAPLHRRHLRRRHHLSLPIDPDFRHPPPGEVQAVFFGLGSDGTVGANKASVKIIGEGTDLHAQGYFVYDSKKSGSVTVSHLRFGPEPIRSTYLIDTPTSSPATSSACSRRSRCSTTPARRHLPAQQPVRPDEVWDHLPARGAAQQLIDKGSTSGSSTRSGRRRGRHGQPHQHRDAAVLLPALRRPAGRRGHRPHQGVRREDLRPSAGGRRRAQLRRHRPSLERAAPRPVPRPRSPPPPSPPVVPDDAPDFVQRVTAVLMAGRGRPAAGQRLPVDGTFPTGTEVREAGDRQRSRSGTRTSASTAASAPSSARTPRSA
jgi:pyruvate-ferredoxin/flavodoxin oxidoreductase